jgi:hypothetical protein
MTTIVTAAGLRRDAQEFLRFKRAMGIVYRRAEFDLDGFVHFVAQHWGDHGEVTLEDAISRWCARIPGRKAVSLGNEFGVIRQLCLYRRRRDPSSYVPEHALAPVKVSVFLPYIFSHDEVRRLLAAATSHRGRSIVAPTLRALILVRLSSTIAHGRCRSQARHLDDPSQQKPFSHRPYSSRSRRRAAALCRRAATASL